MDLTSSGVESVLTEENRATCIMGRVEAIREELVVNIFGRLLQGRVMPPPDILFEGIFFSPTGSGVPVVGAESPLHNRTGRKAFYWNCSCEKRKQVFSQMPREILLWPSQYPPYAGPRFGGRSF